MPHEMAAQLAVGVLVGKARMGRSGSEERCRKDVVTGPVHGVPTETSRAGLSAREQYAPPHEAFPAISTIMSHLPAPHVGLAWRRQSSVLSEHPKEPIRVQHV